MLLDLINLMLVMYSVIVTLIFPNPLSVLFWHSEDMELWSLESSQIFRGSSMDPAQGLDTPNLDWLKVSLCREPRGGLVDHSFVTT